MSGTISQRGRRKEVRPGASLQSGKRTTLGRFGPTPVDIVNCVAVHLIWNPMAVAGEDPPNRRRKCVMARRRVALNPQSLYTFRTGRFRTGRARGDGNAPDRSPIGRANFCCAHDGLDGVFWKISRLATDVCKLGAMSFRVLSHSRRVSAGRQDGF
jgi:hypothetical protein